MPVEGVPLLVDTSGGDASSGGYQLRGCFCWWMLWEVVPLQVDASGGVPLVVDASGEGSPGGGCQLRGCFSWLMSMEGSHIQQ